MTIGTLLRGILIAGGIAVAAPTGLLAKEQAYECDLTQIGNNGGFGEKMYVSFTDGWTNPAVLDATINEIHKAPIPVELISNDGKRVRIRWELTGLKYSQGYSIGRVIYKGSLDKKKLDIRMESLIPSNDGRYLARGQCKEIK